MSDLQLLLQAAHFAALRHTQQRRKGENQEPYVNHLLEVAQLLTECGQEDIVLLQAALLHDSVEDVGVTVEELALAFGSEVAQLVLEVTDDKNLPKAQRKQLQVEKSGTKSPRARMLKIADKISNLRAIRNSPPPDWSQQRRLDYFDWARRVVEGCRGVCAPLDQLFDQTHSLGPGPNS